jgi:hypothetical protein
MKNDVLVPFRLRKGIPWADCKWVFIDTIRMIFITIETYNTAPASNKMFWGKKLAKYVGKYIHLNMNMKNNATMRPYLKKAMKILGDTKVSGVDIRSMMLFMNSNTQYKSFSKVFKTCEKITKEIAHFNAQMKIFKTAGGSKEDIKTWFNNDEIMIRSKLRLTFSKNSVMLNGIIMQ